MSGEHLESNSARIAQFRSKEDSQDSAISFQVGWSREQDNFGFNEVQSKELGSPQRSQRTQSKFKNSNFHCALCVLGGF
jgi:hypothetical protein